MARAAVKAKQQAKAKVQPAKPRARGRRRHSGGGNPNQDLFFIRLRRHQKWVYALLALVFAVSFVLVGVGSGNGGGLSQLYTGIFGGGGSSSVSKAKDEIKKDPAKGYRDLATAYEQNGDNAQAITALQRYLLLKGKDAGSWAEAGGLELTQGNTYAKQYQQAQQAQQTADPSAPFQAGGTLSSAAGTNPVYQGASQTAATRTSLLAQKATSAFAAAVTDYQRAVKVHPRSTTYLEELATAAGSAGNIPVTLHALRSILKYDPSTPQKPQIEKEIAALSKQQPSVSSGNGH